MTPYFKNKAKRKVSLKPAPPRSLEEITKEYQEVLGKAAQAQYFVYVHSKELEQFNQRLVQVNMEAAERQKLDKEASAAETTSVGAADNVKA